MTDPQHLTISRGINVATFDPDSGAVVEVVNFDTWGTRTSGQQMRRLIAYLEALDSGALVLMAVADEAGINRFDSCDRVDASWVTAGLDVVEAVFGSAKLRSYCYRDSWAMVGFVGAERPLAESLTTGAVVTASSALPFKMNRRALWQPLAP